MVVAELLIQSTTTGDYCCGEEEKEDEEISQTLRLWSEICSEWESSINWSKLFVWNSNWISWNFCKKRNLIKDI